MKRCYRYKKIFMIVYWSKSVKNSYNWCIISTIKWNTYSCFENVHHFSLSNFRIDTSGQISRQQKRQDIVSIKFLYIKVVFYSNWYRFRPWKHYFTTKTMWKTYITTISESYGDNEMGFSKQKMSGILHFIIINHSKIHLQLVHF